MELKGGGQVFREKKNINWSNQNGVVWMGLLSLFVLITNKNKML